MLRAFDEKGGIGVYTRNITDELLDLDRHNLYVLLYANEANLGRYADRPNVTELHLPGSNRLLWDQVAVPRALSRARADVLFHPKFTVPLATSVPSVMVLHGADWLVPDQARYYDRMNVWYMRRALPLYCRKAAAIISVAKLTTADLHRAISLPIEKTHTIYFAPARRFRRIEDNKELSRVRRLYNLPRDFIFTLSKPRGDRRKNLGGVLEAYRRHHGRTRHKLVIGGDNCVQFRDAYGIPLEGWGRDVLFPGWIDPVDMPALYSLADLYLYPSNLEAFPIPITEAMACGTPIVTSEANGLREIAGDAAIRVDPADPVAICNAMGRVLTDAGLRRELIALGIERSRRYSWDRCAKQTLSVLTAVAERKASSKIAHEQVRR
jgi:glycosyltransferase involved in cell wall biosynthesis